VPVGHGTHPVPSAFECWPATHCEHAPPGTPVQPEMHVQAVERMLPANEREFAGQKEHATSPDTGLYSPAVHCEQAPPFAPVQPALHAHAAAEAPPAGESEFRGHV